MKVIILAAGYGTRMGLASEQTPKCLMNVNRKTLLERQLELLEKSGVSRQDIYVVIAEKGKCWTTEQQHKVQTITPNVIFDPKTKPEYNQVFSFLVGLNQMPNEDLLVMDGDLIIKQKLLKELISKSNTTNLLCQEAKETNQPGNKVIFNEDNRIVKVTRDETTQKFLVYAGLFSIGKKEVHLFRKVLENEDLYSKDLGVIFDKLCANINFQTTLNNNDWININTTTDLELASKKF